MSPSTILKCGALAVACASTALATYVLEDDYSGPDFFDSFNFITNDWGSQGYVNYLDQADAYGSGDQYLIKYDSDTGANYVGVDYWSTLDSSSTGRASVRIETPKTYTHGLFIIDLGHMPSSTCGLWPAFWTASNVSYPSQGEIDIIENIHTATVNKNTLHTYPGFEVSGNEIVSNQETDVQTTWNCDDTATSSPYGSQYQNQGCSATSTDPNSYGDTFNAAGGGIYALEWTSDVIQIWNWEGNSAPGDIGQGNPDPTGWGTPAFTTANGIGAIDDFFQDHQIILNTDFCGSWAGQPGIWEATSCYDATLYPSCVDYVAVNPEVYTNAYWLVNSIKVYTESNVVSSTTTSSTTTSTSTTSTSSVTTTTSATQSITSTTTSATTTPTTSTVSYGNSTGGYGYTTSTVYTTSVYTVTECPATVTNCPARIGQLTTETLVLYTTVCPLTATTSTPLTYTQTLQTTAVTTISGQVTTCVGTTTQLVTYTPGGYGKGGHGGSAYSTGASVGTVKTSSTAAGTWKATATPTYTGSASGLKVGIVGVVLGAVVAMLL